MVACDSRSSRDLSKFEKEIVMTFGFSGFLAFVILMSSYGSCFGRRQKLSLPSGDRFLSQMVVRRFADGHRHSLNPENSTIVLFYVEDCVPCKHQLKELTCFRSRNGVDLKGIGVGASFLDLRSHWLRSNHSSDGFFIESVPEITMFPKLLIRTPTQYVVLTGFRKCREIDRYLSG